MRVTDGAYFSISQLALHCHQTGILNHTYFHLKHHCQLLTII